MCLLRLMKHELNFYSKNSYFQNCLHYKYPINVRIVFPRKSNLEYQSQNIFKIRQSYSHLNYFWSKYQI